MNEIWRDIPGYEGFYQASSNGNIRSRIDGYRTHFNKVLKPTIGNHGYYYVTLCRDKIQKKYLVHRLILKTFIGQCPISMESRHLDGNRLNNNIKNLIYGTRSQNAKDRIKHNTSNTDLIRSDVSGSKNPMSKLSEKDILIIRDQIKNHHRIKDIAENFNISPSVISSIKHNRLWKHTI